MSDNKKDDSGVAVAAIAVVGLAVILLVGVIVVQVGKFLMGIFA